MFFKYQSLYYCCYYFITDYNESIAEWFGCGCSLNESLFWQHYNIQQQSSTQLSVLILAISRYASASSSRKRQTVDPSRINCVSSNDAENILNKYPILRKTAHNVLTKNNALVYALVQMANQTSDGTNYYLTYASNVGTATVSIKYTSYLNKINQTNFTVLMNNLPLNSDLNPSQLPYGV